MPNQDGNSVGAASDSTSSGQVRAANANLPPSDTIASDESRTAGPSNLTHRHDPADNNDENPEFSTKGSKAKSSDTLRRSQACLACRKRKLRCDAKKPTCTRCEKAWLAYHPEADASSSAKASPPPCEYDASLLTKIFKRGGSNDPPTTISSQPCGSRQRLRHEDQLTEENEQLRAQISQLQRQLLRDDKSPGPPLTRHSTNMRSQPQDQGTTAKAASRLSVQTLTDSRHNDVSSHKRLKSSHNKDVDVFRPQGSMSTSSKQSYPAGMRRDSNGHPLPQPYAGLSSEATSQPRACAITPSVLSWRSSVQSSSSVPTWTASSQYRHEPNSWSTIDHDSLPLSNFPPLPNRQILERVIETCRHEFWLFAAINAYALADVLALLATTSNTEIDQVTARALMLAMVGVGLPLVASAFPKGVSSSATFKDIDDLLRTHLQIDLPHLDGTGWIPTATRIYSDAARSLLNQAQAKSAGLVTPATFLIRLLLVEHSRAHLAVASAQLDLASAVCEARLLHLHSSVSLTLERSSIRTSFPGRVEADSVNAAQHNLDEVEAHIQRRRGVPTLEPSDNSMSLLIKVGSVLDQCCEHAIECRRKPPITLDVRNGSSTSQNETDRCFLAAHEGIRNSRIMLSQFDDRTVSRSDRSASPAASSNARSRERFLSNLLLQDRVRFAAEVTHHLAVLSLFETAMNTLDPFIQAGEARSIMCNAAVWLSRLAGMALQNEPLIFTLPSFCSSAFFIAARWLIFLQGAELDQFNEDILALTMVLRKRGERYSRDHILAKSIVALKREFDFYGRICISPFTWPIEAISEFIPAPHQEATRGRSALTQATEAGFASIATLAATIDDAAVLKLAGAPPTSPLG
uniref:Zn(2)-C6 fungal-type domain-containing protein n=1 Tax=Melanopsichium pennsylvanicum 4 TaxID=1398559 RepID=A0A077R7K0_9BASI|nr:putative protein [Melanopsichium pennsylvanicum 4]